MESFSELSQENNTQDITSQAMEGYHGYFTFVLVIPNQMASVCMWYTVHSYPDNKIHGANMGPTWVLSAPGGSHVGPTNLAIRLDIRTRFTLSKV